MMKLFDEIIKEIWNYINNWESKETVSRKIFTGPVAWPPAGKRDIVLRDDVGFELGRPQDVSSSFFLWTNNSSLIKDNNITLIGNDVADCKGKSLSFGRVVLIGGSDFNEENCFDRYQEMSHVRNQISFKGYMVRAVSRHMKEWIRISKEAVQNGFSLFTLGNTMIEKLKQIDYIDSVEILMVTSESCITEFAEIGERAGQYVHAIRKMGDELNFDCTTCDYEDVCTEVDDLKNMKSILQKRKDSKS